MGCTAREKHIRTNRRTRSTKPDPPDTPKPETPLPKPDSDETGWGYCTEEQLEEILLTNLEYLYNEATNKLLSLGYANDVVSNAILRNGHCYGGMDVLTNILHNSLAYLDSNGEEDEEETGSSGPAFVDLRQLEEYSLSGMVSLLQQVKPGLSKGDSMWCLLMSDLHVGRASVMEVPVLPSNSLNSNGIGNGEIALGLCRFHGGWGYSNNSSGSNSNGFLSCAAEMALQKEIECPKRFNLSPSMKRLLKRNVAMFAAGFRANSKHFQSQSCSSSSSSGELGKSEEKEKEKEDVVNTVMSKFKELNLDEKTGEKVALDKKDEMIISLIHQLKELEKQVKERKEWAHEKAMQAARKLSNDLTELKMLRMDREETQRMKGKQTLEDSTLKKLAEMENALRKASGQVDRANASVKRLEVENAEIRAEMEASKLSASESVNMCLEVAKREKKCLKKLLVWEKQKVKMQEDIAAEKVRIAELQRELEEVEDASKDAEAKWRNEQKAKEQALAQLEEERRFKEASEANNKRKLETLRLKIEIDFQRHKDDLQRLEQEYARLRNSAQSTEQERTNEIWTENSDGLNQQGETIARLLHELNQLEDSSEKEAENDRECMICMKDEISVVFLPCAHQVICASCNETYGKKGKATCPCCRAPIEQRIRVYGASS